MTSICFVIAIILAFWGGMINEETAPSLLSGYNTMDEEKKKKVNFKGIAKIYNAVFYTIAALLVLIGSLSYFFENGKLWGTLFILTITWGFIPLFFLGKKYDPNTYSKWQYAINYIVLAFLFFSGLAMTIMIYMDIGDFNIE